MFFLNIFDYPCLIPLLFLLKLYRFIEQIWRLSRDSSNCLPLITNKEPKSTRNKSNFEFIVCVTLTSLSSYIKEPNHWLNSVNNLQSRPATKTIICCIDNALNIQACSLYLFNIWTRHSRTHPISPLNLKNRCWILWVVRWSFLEGMFLVFRFFFLQAFSQRLS